MPPLVTLLVVAAAATASLVTLLLSVAVIAGDSVAEQRGDDKGALRLTDARLCANYTRLLHNATGAVAPCSSVTYGAGFCGASGARLAAMQPLAIAHTACAAIALVVGAVVVGVGFGTRTQLAALRVGGEQRAAPCPARLGACLTLLLTPSNAVGVGLAYLPEAALRLAACDASGVSPPGDASWRDVGFHIATGVVLLRVWSPLFFTTAAAMFVIGATIQCASAKLGATASDVTPPEPRSADRVDGSEMLPERIRAMREAHEPTAQPLPDVGTGELVQCPVCMCQRRDVAPLVHASQQAGDVSGHVLCRSCAHMMRPRHRCPFCRRALVVPGDAV